MSLKPWLPVPMTPSVIRLLGATFSSAEAEPGTSSVEPRDATEAAATCRRNRRREDRVG